MTETEWKLTKELLETRKAMIESQFQLLNLTHAKLVEQLEQHGTEYKKED